MKQHVITVKQKQSQKHALLKNYKTDDIIKFVAILITKISAISIFFLYYFTDQFNAEYGVNIDNIKWHFLLVTLIKVIIPTTIGIILIGVFYSFGIASILNKINRWLKEKSFKSFLKKNEAAIITSSIMSYRKNLKIAKNKRSRENNNKIYKQLPLKYKVFFWLLTTPIFTCFILLLLFFIDKEMINHIQQLPLVSVKTFDIIFYTLSIICGLIVFTSSFIYKYEDMKMIRQNKMISNPNSKIFNLFIPSLLYIVAWVYLLLFTLIYKINAVDPYEFFILIVFLMILTMAIFYVKNTIIKAFIMFTIIIAVLLSPIGYFAFKHNLNKNIYISHENNYILIDKECYQSNKQLLDLNQLAHKFLSTESFYYIESFTKLINQNKLILKESPEVKRGNMKYYGFNLVNCKNIIVEDCIESFNNICSK